MESPALVGIGAAHVDRIGQVTGTHHPGASNPGKLNSTVGGGTFNALRAAVLRGLDSAALISARGGDEDGRRIAETIEASGVEDRSAVFLDRSSASYTAILDETGEQVTGLADMAIYETALPRQLRRKPVRETIAAAGAVLCDANVTAEAVNEVCRLATGPVFSIAVSPAKSVRLLDSAAALHTVFLNQRELKALTGEADKRAGLAKLAGLGFGRAVVTEGRKPICLMDEGEVSKMPLPQVPRVTDVTGAGDALAGATIAALVRGRTLREAVLDGIAAAQLTLAVHGPVAPSLIGPEFEAIRERARAMALD